MIPPVAHSNAESDTWKPNSESPSEDSDDEEFEARSWAPATV